MVASTSVDDIIENYASSLELPLGEQSTIDRVIDFLVLSVRRWSAGSWSDKMKEDLLKVVDERAYRGVEVDTMFLLYDTFINDSQKVLPYGIQAFEALGRDPKKLVRLENPDMLVGYAIDTAESLEDLVGLKNTIITEGRFMEIDDYMGVNSDTKRLANSLLLVANEIAYRLRDFDIRNITEEQAASMGWEKHMELYKQYITRLEAHGAIVMAYQAKGKDVVNKEALKALAAYESLAEKYQSVSMYTKFSVGLMREYARIKYGANKPSTGEVPEELKADPDKFRASMFFGGFDWDQYFRDQFFGSKEPEWEKRERQRAQQRSQSKRFQAGHSTGVRWSDYNEELQLLGVTSGIPYEEAKKIFRQGLWTRRSTFIRMDIGTQEYEAAMSETGRFLDAWNKVQPLYLQNKKP